MTAPRTRDGPRRRAKIVATLGPASAEAGIIRELLIAGVDIVRLNLAHGDRADHRRTIDRVRSAARDLGLHVPVLADLVGPRYRLGALPTSRHLETGTRLVITDSGGDLPLARPGIVRHLNVGERLLIDNGSVELTIERCADGRAEARVVRGGSIGSGKGLNLPETNLPYEISPRDAADLAFCVESGVDLIGASYVGSADDLSLLRHHLAASGARIPVVAKIERASAVTQIETIVAASDAVMVARGDLGVELPLESVPPLQRRIVDAGRSLGIPTIVATDMLASMIQEPQPTRAEVSDVANAVFEGADALMLSGETAIGRYPLQAVRMMARTIASAEQRDGEPARAGAPTPASDPPPVADAVARAAADVAVVLRARRIVAFTQTGSTARLVARYRPSIPIHAFTPDEKTARRVQLVWGVTPSVVALPELDEDVAEQAANELVRSSEAGPGDVIVVLAGMPLGKAATNLLRVHQLRS